MNKRTTMKHWLLAISLTILGGSMSVCAGGANWKEEVLLHDGQKIIVERSITRGGRHEIGQQPPVKEERLGFTIPGTNESVTWKSEYSEDIGFADLGPLLVDLFQGATYIVSVPVGCLSYNKWGRPNPPYIVLKYQNAAWNRISLQELPAEIKTPNLIFSSPDNEVEKLGKRFVTAAMVQHANSDLTQPEFKTILRTPLSKERINEMCAEMVYDGHGGWLGIDWFTTQPTYEACLDVCKRNEIGPQHCPCDRLFIKGEK